MTKPSLKPSLLQEVASLRAELNDIKRQIRSIPSNFQAPLARRIAQSLRIPGHGFSAGDPISYQWDQVTAGYVWAEGNANTTVAIVERVSSADLLVAVFSGLIDTTEFPSGFGTYLDGTAGFKEYASSTSAVQALQYEGANQSVVMLPAKRPPNVVFILYEYDPANSSAGAWVLSDSTIPEITSGGIGTGLLGVKLSRAVIDGAQVPNPQTGYPAAWTGVAVAGSPPEYSYRALLNAMPYEWTKARVLDLGGIGGAPRWTLTDGTFYPRSPLDLIGTNMVAWGDAGPMTKTTDVSKAARRRVEFFGLTGSDQFTFSIGDEFDIAHIDPVSGTAYLHPPLNRALNVSTASLANHDILEWSATLKKWLNVPHYPAGGTDGLVLGVVSGSPAWVTGGGGGGSSLGLSLEANCGTYFSDGTLGPKTTPATLTLRPFKELGEILYCDPGLSGSPDAGGNYLVSRLIPTTSTAVLTLNNSKALIWRQSLNGQVMVHDQGLGVCKFSYTLKLGDGSNEGVFEVGHTGRAGTVKLFLKGSTIVDLTGTPSVTGKTLSLKELDVCDSSGVAKKILVIASAPY